MTSSKDISIFCVLKSPMCKLIFKTSTIYKQEPKVYNKNGKTKIIAVDTGIKNNQIRCLMACDALVKVVPWDYNFVPELVSKGDNFKYLCSFTEQIHAYWFLIVSSLLLWQLKAANEITWCLCQLWNWPIKFIHSFLVFSNGKSSVFDKKVTFHCAISETAFT